MLRYSNISVHQGKGVIEKKNSINTRNKARDVFANNWFSEDSS
jgi:hypothetical protein